MELTIVIVLLTIIALLVCIIFDIRLKLGKKSIGLYCIVPILCAILLLLFNRLPIDTLAEYFVSQSNLNPIKILLLFLSMTIFSVVLDEAGFFTYFATLAVKRASGNQRSLFFALFVVVALLTVFTSNDVVILTVTPFVIAFCNRAKCNPLPHLLLEFITANTWSMLLVIGNPTNIFIASAFDIAFYDYFITMALPTIASGLTSIVVIYLLFAKSLKTPMSVSLEEAHLKDKGLALIAGIHLLVCVVLLAVSNFISVPMWLISTITACLLVVCTVIYLIATKQKFSPLKNSFKRLPYEVIPFVIGMFAIVLCLKLEGVTEQIYAFFEKFNGVFTYGFGCAIGSNLINNIPASVLFAQVLNGTTDLGVVYATIMGSNIGAYITPVGALAGIMWHNILSHHGVKLSFGKFCLFGIVVAIPTLLAGLAVLSLVI